MVKRNEKGKLSLKALDFEILIGDMLEKCKTEKEINWLSNELTQIVDSLVDERTDELEKCK